MSEFVLAKLEIEETAATIAADRDFVGEAVNAIKAARGEIERQIRRDRFFLTTLEPYEPTRDCPRIIRRMCDASEAAGVGPMATVAGAIAQEAVEAMVSQGCTHCWVDNGGDIALRLDRPATLEVFSDPSSKNAYAMVLEPTDDITGICTSSGRLGHSISFGDSDVALAIADDAVLADALATAIGNQVTNAASLELCFDKFRRVRGFRAGLAMIDGAVATCGKIPQIVETEHNPDRLTSHSRMSSRKFVGAHEAQGARA